MRHTIYIFLIITSIINVACTSALPSIKPYKVDVQQGNVVTYKMVEKLRPGMTKSQVRYIMGTPLLQDTFHTNRWDYFYQMRQDGKISEQRRIVLNFEDDRLLDIGGDKVTEAAVDPISNSRATLLAAQSREGLIDRLQFWKEDKTIQPVDTLASKTEEKAKEEEEGILDKLAFWKSDDDEKEEVADVQQAVESAVEPEVPSVPVPEIPEVPVVAAVAPVVAEVPSVADVETAPLVADVESVDVPAEVAVPEVPALPDVVDVPPVETAKVEMVEAAEMEKLPVETTSLASDKDAAIAAVQKVIPVPAAPWADSDIDVNLLMDNHLKTRSARLAKRVLTPLNGMHPKLQFVREADMALFKANPATEAALEGPAESGPGYFERMLEKIGF